MDEAIKYLRTIIGNNEWQAYLIAFGLIIVTALIARLCTFAIKKLTQRDGSPLPSSSIMTNTVRVIIWIIGISIILSGCFDVNVSGIITALGVGGIAISLGLQDTIKNFFGGIQITLMKIVEPGDHIVYGSTEGIVRDVSWRQTIIDDFLGHRHIVPNASLSNNEIIKIIPSGLITCKLTIDNTHEELNDLIHRMSVIAGTAIKKVAPLKSMPWIRVESIGQDTINADLFFILRDIKNVQEARDVALRALAAYAVKPYGISADDDSSDNASSQGVSLKDTSSDSVSANSTPVADSSKDDSSKDTSTDAAPVTVLSNNVNAKDTQD